MEFSEYQEKARSSKAYPDSIGLGYAALGLTGEAGEVANKIKKVYRDHGGELSPEQAQAIADECGDVLWYAAALCSMSDPEITHTASAGLTMAHLREMMRKIPQPSVWETGPIYVIGLPGSVHQFIRAIERLNKPIPIEMPMGLPMGMLSTGPNLIAMPSNVFPDADYIFLNAGKEFRKVYLISFDEFMRRWKRDGEELAALIERLEGYSR